MTTTLILRLRTRDNLLNLLEAGQSGNWIVAQNKEQQIQKVQIFNWDGSLMLEASLNLAKTSRVEDDRLIVGLLDADAKITKYNPPLRWSGQNPVNYVNEAGETQEEG